MHLLYIIHNNKKIDVHLFSSTEHHPITFLLHFDQKKSNQFINLLYLLLVFRSYHNHNQTKPDFAGPTFCSDASFVVHRQSSARRRTAGESNSFHLSGRPKNSPVTSSTSIWPCRRLLWWCWQNAEPGLRRRPYQQQTITGDTTKAAASSGAFVVAQWRFRCCSWRCLSSLHTQLVSLL